jgi:hypothetical protein
MYIYHLTRQENEIMNLEKFGSARSFEDIENCVLFMAARASEVFYGTKGFIKRPDTGTPDDVLICLGPSKGSVAPCIYSPSVLHGQLVLDLNARLQLIPSIKVEDTKTFHITTPSPGDLVFVQDKVLLTVRKEGFRSAEYFFNVETGEITVGLYEPHGYIVRGWKLQTVDPVAPEILLSFP